MTNYEEVPSIITGKDLDYLSDIYNWNFNACKVVNNIVENIQDQDIKELFNEVSNLHSSNSKIILDILR